MLSTVCTLAKGKFIEKFHATRTTIRRYVAVLMQFPTGAGSTIIVKLASILLNTNYDLDNVLY